MDHSIMPEDPNAYIMLLLFHHRLTTYLAPRFPPSPDYIPGPEEPQSPPPLDFVLSPSRRDDEDPEEDPADYPADRDDDEDEEEEEEEHPSPADSVPLVHHMTTRISIWDEPSISLPPREEVKRLLALTTLPPSPLTPLSSPLPHIPSPPLPASPPLQLLSFDHKTDSRDYTTTPRTRLVLTLVLGKIIEKSSAAATTRPIRGRRADYGFVDTMDTEIRRQRAEELAGNEPRGVQFVNFRDANQVDSTKEVQLTKALELLQGLYSLRWSSSEQLTPQKVQHMPDAPGEAGSSS
ncbi:hypothetical protein Tco_0969799 [Tanacetum coccineum]